MLNWGLDVNSKLTLQDPFGESVTYGLTYIRFKNDLYRNHELVKNMLLLWLLKFLIFWIVYFVCMFSMLKLSITYEFMLNMLNSFILMDFY